MHDFIVDYTDDDEFDSEAACNRAKGARNRLEKEEFLQVHMYICEHLSSYISI